MEVISLLESKGRCLRKFLVITQEALTALEAGDFSGLSQLERRRTHLVNAIRLFDDRVSLAANQVPLAERTDALAERLREVLEEQTQTLAQIVRADASVESCIEAEKERLRVEITANTKAQKSIQSHQRFKSQWVQDSGSGLDQKL